MFKRIDLLLLGITVVLTLFGLAMIASVSVFESYQLTTNLYGEGWNSFYLWRTFLHVTMGMGVMMFMASIPYRLWERLAKPMYFATVVLLVLVFIPALKPGGAQTSNSWISLGFFTLQPAEILKLTFIFYLSVWLQKREQLIGTFKEGFVPFATLLLISTFLVAIQPDLGSFLVLAAIAAVMFLIAGGGIFHLLLGGGLAGIIGLPVILQKEYIRLRFIGFITILLQPGDTKICESKAGYQICNALIAIGSGGFFGVGYGKSIQKFGYLPEVQGDMIFSVMAEELGFVRLMIILLMYGILVYRGFRIAENAPDRFGFLLASGITTWIAVQTLINIGVNTGVFPLTGLTLPFISYGGSSLITLLAAIGILLNISMHSTEEASLARRAKVKSAATKGWRMRRA
jgi:cell division protein FtsW